MAKVDALTAEQARQLIDYDPETGMMTWKPRTPDMFEPKGKKSASHICAWWNAQFAGKPAGCVNSKGYIVLGVYDVLYLAHRVAWLIMTGKWPEDQIDHEDTDRANNRWGNLREATASQNLANRAAPSSNSSGFKGVSWHKKTGKWAASIKKMGKTIHLGQFDTPEAAGSAYASATEHLNGEFARVV